MEQGVGNRSEKKQIKAQGALQLLKQLRSRVEAEERLLSWLESLERQLKVWQKNDFSTDMAQKILKLCARYSG